MNSISVVIPTFCRPTALRDTVRDLQRQTVRPGEIIIADSAPPDQCERPAWIDAESDVRYVVAEIPSNANAARNAALALATGTYVLLLDDDLSLPEDCLEAFLAVHAEGYDAVHGHLTERGQSLEVPPSLRGNRPFWRTVRHRHGAQRAHTIAVSSGFTSIRRSVLTALGPLDEAFAFQYDDYDLGYRIWNAGATLIHDPRPQGAHLRSAEGRDQRSPVARAGPTAKYYFVRKHFTRRAVRVELITDLLLTFWDEWKRPWRVLGGWRTYIKAYRAARRLRSASAPRLSEAAGPADPM